MDGRSVRWSAHNDAQRRRIVAAAIELYDEGRLDASVQEIGQRAGMSRSVVYRQFADRRDLENAVQRHILAELWEQLAPSFEEAGPDSFRTGVATYVAWAASHPRLHQVAGLDRGSDGPLQQAIGYLSSTLARTLAGWLRREGAHLDEDDLGTIDALSYGVVGMVFAAVKRWVDHGVAHPSAERLAGLVAESAWLLVETRARALGVVATG